MAGAEIIWRSCIFGESAPGTWVSPTSRHDDTADLDCG